MKLSFWCRQIQRVITASPSYTGTNVNYELLLLTSLSDPTNREKQVQVRGTGHCQCQH